MDPLYLRLILTFSLVPFELYGTSCPSLVNTWKDDGF